MIIKIFISDESAAESWKAEVQRLNEDTKMLLDQVGLALQNVQQGADSDIVDDIVKYGNQILSGTGKILDGMNELVTTVTSILKAVNAVLDTGKGIVKGVVNAIGNI